MKAPSKIRQYYIFGETFGLDENRGPFYSKQEAESHLKFMRKKYPDRELLAMLVNKDAH